MDGFLDDSAREAMVLNALSDKSSGFYQGLVKVLLNCEAADRHSRLSQPFVTLPFFLDEVETAALEAQFNVVIKVKGSILRARASPRVAGLFFLVDSALLEHAGGCGRSVLLVDGDLVTTAACGIESRIVERSGATPRLATGYFLEDDALKRFGTVRSGAINAAADVLMREQTFGGGDHYWPRVRDDGPIVDSIVVNHLKTPVGLRQLAWLAYKRQAVLYGAIPFQVEMLTQDTGRLNCFPGFFYVDKEADVITLVPESDATMSISHPYSALMGIVQSNSVTVGGVEFLCEKYCSVRGILYYTLHRVDVAFDAPEVLRTNYFDASCLGVTEISYPEVKLSSEGIPVGWTRGKVRILTARCEKVMSRVATSTNAVVTPAEVFTALMDYNNSVVASLDTVMSVDRMSVDNENKAALAIALHVNWTRDLARGTFNVLMQAIRVRHEAKNANLVKLAMLALSAWWGRPNISSEIKYGELPISKVVDWCGNDFSVVMQDADPWIEMVEEVGRKAESTDKQYPWFPSVAVGDTWYSGLMQRVYGVVGRPVQKAVVKKPISRPFRRSIDYITEAKPVVALSLVDETEIRVDRPLRELTDIKQALARKMHADQGAYGEVVPGRYLLVRHQVETGVNDSIPVVAVDPISSIRDDVLMCNGGPFDRNMVATGYRIAEVDIDKVTEGNFSVNDAKRLIPAARWVRQPKVDAGVEGKRVSSQAALMGALFKRNIGVPANRGAVDLDLTPKLVVEKVIQVCYRDDWREIVNKHLNTGMWEPNAADIDDFVAVLDETKVKKLLDEFFLEGHVDLQRWMLMAKGKIKSSREPGADAKIDHSQTIMYLENSSTNAMYSAMTRRFKECLDECLRPEVCLNGQRSDSEQEEWYNSLDSVRRSFPITHSYSADVKCYDRSQEHTGLGIDLEWYRVHGLGPERLEIWSQTHGTKRAIAMMFGVILTMVLGGVSGLWKTLLRNGLINLAAIVVSTGITRRDVVMIDIKGDDSDCEFSRPIEVESTIERMSLTFNFSAKFFTNNVRYMCKQFRIKLNGRWIFVSDPWARVQSLCTPLWIGNKEDNLEERWISLCADLRHYENGLAVDAVAEAAQQYYGTERPLYGFARGLAAIKADRGMYFNFFDPPVKID